MIATLIGKPTVVNKNVVVLDVGGVGYEVRVTADDAQSLEGMESALLHTVFSLKQDKVELFGFLAASNKALFVVISGISGVGGKTALALLSQEGKQLLLQSIEQNNPLPLTQLAGVGKKLAEKIVLECKHKKDLIDSLQTHCGDGRGGNYEVVSALLSLGVPRAAAIEAASSVDAKMPIEEAIKAALAQLRK
jgi:Holliday junction DNA helicase RuvA